MPSTAPDFRPYRTADGSLTLRSDAIDEHYHSVVGAVNESTHVYVQAGLEYILGGSGDRPIDLLEIGLGTGLNLLLTWIRCLEGKCAVNYTALEPYPLARDQLLALDHWNDLAWPGLEEPFLERMTVDRSYPWPAIGGLTFQRLVLHEDQFKNDGSYDVIYFDAFGPNTQPEMWTAEVMARMYKALRPGGVLVTYCAKGDVRRTMQSVGFSVDRIQGPPGKREMLRGTRTP